MHIQEHKMAFDKIIADGEDLEVELMDTTFKALGYDYEGETQALVFNSTVKANRNKYMFDQYRDGRVKNHSVGMQYVKIFLAINDKNEPENYRIWQKYINEVANKETAEDNGYFFAVTEAKLIEGSAVPIGSNVITPTLQPEKSTVTEPTSSLEAEDISNIFKSILN